MNETEVTKEILDALSLVGGLVSEGEHNAYELIATEIKRRNVNLCLVCCNVYPECPGMTKPNAEVHYGTVHNDKIYSCSWYISQVDFEEHIENKTNKN
jgi:hypothetical protein